MKVFIFRPKSSPLPIPDINASQTSFIKYNDCEFIKYTLDSDIFMEHIYRFISENNLRDIPQLIYLREVPSIFKLSDVHSLFSNVHMLSKSNGYYSHCLISNARYIKPSNVDLGGAADLIARMYREYKTNKLMDSL